ncbi:MAG: Exodeoxyribonuclease 8 [Nitrospira sp.]|nr:Exodeoxyribonuclease 8 [Nitrospira sp.]
MIPLGIHRDIPAAIYHREPGASASRLRTIHLGTPAHLRLEMQNPILPTWEMQLGTLIHQRILEPYKALPALALVPLVYALTEECPTVKAKKAKAGDMVDWNPRTKYAQNWVRQQEANGLIVVTDDDMFEIDRCVDRVMAHPEARELLEGADTEVTIRWETTCGTQCKARLDMVPRGSFLGDLKTTDDASQRGFERKCLSMGYHLQAAFYLDGWSAMGDREFTGFRFIAYERETGLVSVNQMSAELIQEGRIAYESALEKFIAATRTGIWPAYPGLQMIDTPKWMRRTE